MRAKGLNHVALSVTDMDRTLEFYQRLGLELLRTSGPNPAGERSAVLRVGAQEINVFQRPGLVSVEQENAKGMHHFCFDMAAESIDELVADLRRTGLDVVRGPVERRDGTSLFVSDPDGVRVELRIERRR
jgi:catechol 2,3-dioxygenase-like lactoylglutathione lyase family enzyme